MKIGAINMKKMRILVIFIVFTLISLSTFSAPLSSIKTTNAVNQSELLISFNLNIDIKARNPGGEWQDISLTADNGGQIEFKLTLTSSGGRTLVVVLFPYINEEPMMQYQSLSASLRQEDASDSRSRQTLEKGLDES